MSVVVESNELFGERVRFGVFSIAFCLDAAFFVLSLVGIGDCVDVVEVVVAEVEVVGNFDVGSVDAVVGLVVCLPGLFVVAGCCGCFLFLLFTFIKSSSLSVSESEVWSALTILSTDAIAFSIRFIFC